MKKKQQNFSQYFKMPHLFLEDLEEIESILRELNPRECKIETRDYEYLTIKEITNDTEMINNFHIQTYDPYISLDLDKNSARVYASDNSIKVIGVVKKITDVIYKRERKILWYLSNLSIWIAPLLFSLSILIITKLIKEGISLDKVWIIITVIIFIFLSIVWWIVGFQSSLIKFSVIEFAYKKNKSNFFNRNKDQIIVGMIVAIITIILTLFVQKLFK